MDSSPSKRRKISPTTSVDVNAPVNQRPMSRDGRQTTPSRASFMSPTKASLARFNPSLLPPSKSSKTNAANTGRKKSVFPYQNPSLERRTEVPVDQQAAGGPQAESQIISGVEKSRERFQGPEAASDSLLQMRSMGSGLATTLRQRSSISGQRSSPTKLSPRRPGVITDIPASPPEAMRETEDQAQRTVNEQLDQELQANTPILSQDAETPSKLSRRRASQEDVELELPLTPTQLGLEPVAEAPKGLLFSSPTRRSSRRKRAPIKSSPLKPGDPAPDRVSQDSPHHQTTNAAIEVQDSQPVVDSAEDPELSKKRAIHEQLTAQLKNLQHDIIQLEAEVSRIQNPALSGISSQEETDELISIITSSNPTHAPQSPPPKQPPLSTLITHFLPFSTRLPPPASPSPPLPPSNPPIHISPFSHLRVFTPLFLNSTASLLPPIDPSSPLLRQQTLTLTSPHAILVIQLSLTTNALTQTINTLSLTAISPWADPELGTWIRAQCPSGDVSSVGYAAGRYWEVASTRAQCWRSCHERYKNLTAAANIDNRSTTTPPSKTNRPASSKRKSGRPRKPNLANDTTSSPPPASPTSSSSTPSPPTLSHHSLLPHLTPHLHLSRSNTTSPSPSLLITWTLLPDWTGEIHSQFSACASFPRAWRAIDERGSLGRVGELFEAFMREGRGVRSAVEGVVGVVFGEGKVEGG